jgi:transcription termination factor Rho
VAAEALEQSMLESKDKDQLLAIAQALGIKTNARASKATLIDKILETTGSAASEPSVAAPAPTPVAVPAMGAAPEVILGPDGEPLADWEIELLKKGELETPPPTPAAVAKQQQQRSRPVATPAPAGDRQENGKHNDKHNDQHDDQASDDDDGDDDGDDDDDGHGPGEGEGESRNARRRRRRRNKNKPGTAEGAPATVAQPGNEAMPPAQQAAEPQPQHRGNEFVSQEPVEVSGYLDLRDEGYGFLRVNGYLSSRDDAYVPVRLTRQYGLRRGDLLTGLCRPAGRNEKNPAMLEVHSVNGLDPENARNRRKFEDLTALFPDSRLKLEGAFGPTDITSRVIDLISPIGKGQRGIIVSPPKAGKTTIMKTIATAIEKNHPEVVLMVLLIDERPEEVTDMRRTVKGEVISSTFDRPSEEHTHVAEMVIERAKRLVEDGKDVVIILDGITRLSRAYNLAAPQSGKVLSGGIDAGALYPPKKFFGAARNVEEGGSLTILATALVDTNSRMDDAIFEEFKGTGNMELRLDRRLAERRVFPAIDVDGSSTRHEELLFDRKRLQQVYKLRRVLGGLAENGGSSAGLELLADRLGKFRTNDEFLDEIAKAPSI